MKRYRTGDLALKSINLDVPDGQVMALIGPSGAGKSTAIRCINRLVEPTGGTVILNGTEITALGSRELRRARRRMGMIFQEYALVERLAREVPLRVPQVASRRTRAGERGSQPHWARTIRRATRTGGELAVLQRRSRRPQELPLLVLVDVSGSMERYARLLLAFLHAATRNARRRDVFAFGTHLTDLTPVFRQADTDAMLLAAAQVIEDFAGGTRLGESLAQLRGRHARRLVGGRTLVLLISDGLDTGDAASLAEELGWLKRHCRKLLWLNPLLRYSGYAPLATGAAVLQRFADRMVAVHNLEKLEDLAAQLAAVMKARS